MQCDESSPRFLAGPSVSVACSLIDGACRRLARPLGGTSVSRLSHPRLLMAVPPQGSQVEPWIGNFANGIRERVQAEPAHHVPSPIGTSDAAIGMARQRVVDIFADTRSSQGILVAVPERVEYARLVRDPEGRA
jgi:hypothetical protein